MTQFGRYEILEELGRGGFATVFKARDSQLKRLVALKVLHAGWSSDPDFVRRFQQEAETLAGFRHPHIVGIHDVGEIDRQLFISMEYLPGDNLQRWLARRDSPLKISVALRILHPMAEALDYAHQKGVIHRDIKPSNVMIQEQGENLQVVLTDFGLVKAMENSAPLTMTNQMLGSPEYMAPEQADPNRQQEIGPHSDRYALGVMAYQMLAGRVPFPGHALSTLNAHANLAVPSLQEFNPDLADEAAAVVLRMLAKDPADRYPTAVAFVTALQAAVEPASRTRRDEEEVAALYALLQQARAAADWVEVVSLAAQIDTLSTGYADVAELQAEARRQLVRPQTELPAAAGAARKKPDAALEPVADRRVAPAPESATRSEGEPRRKIPAIVWMPALVLFAGLVWLGAAALGGPDAEPPARATGQTFSGMLDAVAADATLSPARPTAEPAPGGVVHCASADVFCVGLVTMAGKIDDKGFNESAWEAILRAQSELGAQIDYIETEDNRDWLAHLERFASQEYDVIVAVGFAMAEATLEAATQYPDIDFIGVDHFQIETVANVANLIFPDDQAGFLAGALAGEMTRSNIVAAVLGSDQVPPIVAFKEGFEAGARYVNPDITVISTYHPGDLGVAFTDPDWGASTAAASLDQGADVVFGAGGTTGSGALMEVASYEGAYCIGVDTDQWETVPEAHYCLISSAMKLITPGVFDLIQASHMGNFPGGDFIGAVGLAPFHDFDAAISQAIKDRLEEIESGLQKGSITTGNSRE